MLKQNKGITLVALVITIIVLLILAGVSISLVVGDNGVLKQATGASKKTSVAQAKEEVEQAFAGVQGEFASLWAENTNLNFGAWLKANQDGDSSKKNYEKIEALLPKAPDGTRKYTYEYINPASGNPSIKIVVGGEEYILNISIPETGGVAASASWNK